MYSVLYMVLYYIHYIFRFSNLDGFKQGLAHQLGSNALLAALTVASVCAMMKCCVVTSPSIPIWILEPRPGRPRVLSILPAIGFPVVSPPVHTADSGLTDEE